MNENEDFDELRKKAKERETMQFSWKANFLFQLARDFVGFYCSEEPGLVT